MENAGEPNAAQKAPMRSSSVVWLPVGGKVVEMLPWLPAVPTEYEGGIYLPFLQLEKEEGRDGAPFEMSEKSLLFAILIHYQKGAPTLVLELVQPYLKIVLEELAKGYQMSGLEELIIKAAATIRADFGQSISRVALKSGMEIVPESSAIRSDFLLDTWCRLQNGDPAYWKEMAQESIDAFTGFIKEEDYLTAWQAGILTFIVSLAILDRWTEAEAAYGRYKDELEDPEDRQRMTWMLQNRSVDMDRLAQHALGCQ